MPETHPTPLLVHVDLGPRSYDIQIGTGNLSALPQTIETACDTNHAIVVTDTGIESSHAAVAAQALADSGRRVELLVVEAGEPSKSIDVAAALWEKLAEQQADRRSVVVAVGGGVVGDLAGFVAATYNRGLRFVQVPTTLLAQVDSSVGGKVGINLPQGKNLVGAFWQPAAVLIDTATLTTLPDRPYRAGLAEVVKYGVILDAEFFAYLEQHTEALLARDHDVLRHIVARSCRLKADVVQQDERELTGLRAVLNYGHTFCHAFETLTGYDQLLHGEAVAIGMHCAACLAARLNRIPQSLVDRQRSLLRPLKLPIQTPNVDRQQVLEAMRRDKKTVDGRLRFVLPSKLGHVELVDGVQPDDVLAALDEAALSAD